LIQNVYDPQLLNRYSFERNNPLKNIDPDGHGKITFIIGRIEKLLHKFFPFLKDVAISEAVSKFTDEQKKKYKETVPEEERSELVEDVYRLTRGTGDATTGIQGGMIANAKTRHVYLRKTYKLLDDIADVSLVVDAFLGGYYWLKSSTYSPKIQQSIANQANLQQYQEYNRQEIIKQRESGSYSGGSGYNRDAGAYVTQEGRVYPTSNPNFVPNPNAPRVCISGC
jgi:hypothetical protein